MSYLPWVLHQHSFYGSRTCDIPATLSTILLEIDTGLHISVYRNSITLGIAWIICECLICITILFKVIQVELNTMDRTSPVLEPLFLHVPGKIQPFSLLNHVKKFIFSYVYVIDQRTIDLYSYLNIPPYIGAYIISWPFHIFWAFHKHHVFYACRSICIWVVYCSSLWI